MKKNITNIFVFSKKLTYLLRNYKYVNMNFKIKLLSVGASFFIAGTALAQRDTASKEREIEEVVVVGYGTQKKREVTGAISQVKGEALSGLVTPSFEAQLAGRASGVQITTPNGIIGEAPRIRIRGINSVSSGTYPLIVVDGMPIFTGDMGGYASNNALADINPADIESVEILKDGAASAIYGSRAANGVMLITTKKGKQGKTTFNYNTYYGSASVVEKFDLLKTADFITISNEKRSNRNQSDWARGTAYDTDWQDAIFRTATQMDHNFNMSGGLGKGSYYASLGYLQQEGVVVANGMDRLSARFNVDQTIAPWLKMGGSLAANQTTTTGLNTGEASLSGAIYNATKQLPNTPIYDPTNEQFDGYNVIYVGANTLVGNAENLATIANNITNIAYVLNKNKMSSKNTRILGNIYADVKIAPWLTYRAQASVDKSSSIGHLYYNALHGDGVSAKGRVQNSLTEAMRYNWQNILTLNKTFGDHSFTLTGVNEYQKQDVSSFWGAGTDLASDFFSEHLISGSFGTQTTGGSKSDNALISYLARLNYDFGKKYFIQASIREDQLSKFAPAQRKGTFYGASAGWTVSNEAFLADNKTISDLKIRGSWGKVGNTEVGGDYPYLSLYSIGKYGASSGIGFGQMGNPDLTWETSTKTDIGFDLGLFENRLKFTADYFINDINNLIQNVPVSNSLGIPNSFYKANVGRSVNHGWEFSFDYGVVRNADWDVNLSGNVSFVKNEIRELYEGLDLPGTYNITREGLPINTLYGIKFWGVNKANGMPVYYDKDSQLIIHNYSDATYYMFDPNNPTAMTTKAASGPGFFELGNVLPTYFGSLNLTVRYKNFDFNTLARFSGGNKIMNITRRELLSQAFNNNSAEILNRWQSVDKPGDGMTPKLWAGGDSVVNGPSNTNSRFIEKGDFVKLDNITLGYNLSSSLINSVGLQKVRIYAQAQNAVMFTKYKGLDPEMESAGVDYNATPRQKVISVGLNVTF